MRVLGIDPGSTATGYGLVERVGGELRHVVHGTIRPPRQAPLPRRLAHIQKGLAALIEAEGPDLVAVERVFVSNNPSSALVLGQARGAILATLGAAGLEVAELAAREVKQAVAGNGGADKRAVQTMVARQLGLSAAPPQDAADALAIALCHAWQAPLLAAGARRRRARRRPTSVAELRTRP